MKITESIRCWYWNKKLVELRKKEGITRFHITPYEGTPASQLAKSSYIILKKFLEDQKSGKIKPVDDSDRSTWL